MSESDLLAAAIRGSVLAAAGCGKTELIVRTVETITNGHILVLTHTNAGVHALRQRFLRRNVPSARFSVDTLDGWCLRFVKAYPRKAGVVVESDIGEVNWAALRQGMLNLLGLAFIRRVVSASYTGVLVDEYQDCVVEQHAIVEALAKLLPTRVLGDPMQAIFGFGDNKLVEWKRVANEFPNVVSLTSPKRWQLPGANVDLGDWLAKVRPILEKGAGVSLVGSPVEWVGLEGRSIVDVSSDVACKAARECADGERLVVLWKWRPSCHVMAMRTGGYFQCVEPIDSSEGRDAIRKIISSDGVARTEAVLDFAGICCTHIDEKSRRDLLRRVQGEGKASKSPEGQELVQQLQRILGDEPGSEAESLRMIARYPKVRTYRKELFYTVINSLCDVLDGTAECPLKAFSKRRQMTSRGGRRLDFRSVGTPLLLKGLEFEHVVVVDEGKMSAREIYVALTRATRRLTIVGSAPNLTPSGW